MQLGLQLGISHPPLADLVIKTLENWQGYAVRESQFQRIFDDIWPHITPALDGYLVSGKHSAMSAHEAYHQDEYARSSDQPVKKGWSDRDLRRRVLRMLGKDGARTTILEDTLESVYTGETVWDTDLHIILELPLSSVDAVSNAKGHLTLQLQALRPHAPQLPYRS